MTNLYTIMKATIYKIVIFDACENEHTIDSTIFWDRAAALREAERLFNDSDIIADSVYVYEEQADLTGAFRTTNLVTSLIKED